MRSSSVSLSEVIGVRTYTDEEIMVSVTVAQIDPKQASNILQSFATLLPLQQFNLDHMKRVRRDQSNRNILEILMCPERYMDDMPASLKEMCVPNTFRITNVPKLKAITRTEYEEWGRDWPTMFRPNATDKEREKGFTNLENIQHSKFICLVEKDAIDVSSSWKKSMTLVGHSSISSPFTGGGIMVNPQNGMVVASSNL